VASSYAYSFNEFENQKEFNQIRLERNDIRRDVVGSLSVETQIINYPSRRNDLDLFYITAKVRLYVAVKSILLNVFTSVQRKIHLKACSIYLTYLCKSCIFHQYLSKKRNMEFYER